ncbi:DNA-binding transcriptional regulator, PadR family [Desulfoscipio geothermicus DSM 3669]|uniref:DNA-binding transcriptional regulator, PadR family n=1 Tax=Desulfoscipio geothermicus DSM 3669 TaxID=1121426 RepID=A0A1I6DDG5_9FIRM|nr:DNA-binding transcriptional regulator, PadR family [Desulfoscipio geothermicus DSM 3669]
MAAKLRKGKNYRHLPAFLLLFLAENPAHGGALLTLLQKRLPTPHVDSGAVYRALQDLEKKGAVDFRWDTKDPGPAKKIYTITAKGWDMLADFEADIVMRVKNLTFFLETYRSLKTTEFS